MYNFQGRGRGKVVAGDGVEGIIAKTRHIGPPTLTTKETEMSGTEETQTN